VLNDLLKELRAHPAPPDHAADGRPSRDYAGVVIPFELRTPAGILAFFSTTTVFGTPMDITLSELALESFFPADAATAEALRQEGAGAEREETEERREREEREEREASDQETEQRSYRRRGPMLAPA
jgi:hypothetical protein